MRFVWANALPESAIRATAGKSTRRNISNLQRVSVSAHVSIGRMAKKKAAAKGRKGGTGRKGRTATRRKVSTAAPRTRPAFDALLAPVKGATRRNIGHVQLEV